MNSYSTCLLLAILVGWVVWTRGAMANGWIQSPSRSPALVFVVIGVAGARLLAVLGEWSRYSGQLLSFEGPLAIQGAMLGFLGAAAAFARWRRIPTLPMLDLSSLSFAAMVVPIRIGCFTAGCCHGTATTLPWAVQSSDGHAVHPTQIYEVLLGAGLVVLLVRMRQHGATPGRGFAAFLTIYGLGRVTIEGFRDDTVPILASVTYPQVVGVAMFLGGAMAWIATSTDVAPAAPRVRSLTRE